jgi:hypothetical protein
MKKKKISLGLKYSIDATEKNQLLKGLHKDLLDYLNDAPNSYPNIYEGDNILSFSHVLNMGKKQLLQTYIDTTIKFLGYALPANLPQDLEISKRKQFIFDNYSIIDFKYNIANQTLVLEVILKVEDLFLIDIYSNKLLVTELADEANYNNNIQVKTYSIEDVPNLLVLGLM